MKKSVIFVRDFVRGAAHNELGMQGVELVGVGQNSDGVTNELSIGQITELTVYMAAQARPTTKTELIGLGLLNNPNDPESPQLPTDQAAIDRRAAVFGKIGCDTFHKSHLTLVDPIFQELSAMVEFRDDKFSNPSRIRCRRLGLATSHHLRPDQEPSGQLDHTGRQGHPPGFLHRQGCRGPRIVRLYGDLKRHDMGPELAESIDELGNGKLTVIQYPGDQPGSGTGRSTFGTKELWGVGCTDPWLHDGRGATTLREAIRYHGGEGSVSRAAFNKLDAANQKDLFAFLYNQVLYIKEENSTEAPDLSICQPKD